MRHVNIIGVGFVEGLPGLYANCTVWLNDDDTVAGVTPIGQSLADVPVADEGVAPPEPEPASIVVEPAPISLSIG